MIPTLFILFCMVAVWFAIASFKHISAVEAENRKLKEALDEARKGLSDVRTCLDGDK
jgi:hypothetical protein